ncbi:MAG: TetR/AcrR family transcriptional regulator [Myxococcales bacterium]|nr:TetR/AcrR family transcriptional regulator [Myxococcales bacterium]
MSTRQKRLEPRKKPRQRRAQATVEDLLTAAAQVFEALGYACGTTNRIAERAGVSIGTLYQYFPNKEALAVALLERHLAEGMRRLDDWVGRAMAEPRTLRETLELFVEGMIALHDEQPRLQHILLEETPLPPRVHDALLAAEREAARTVAELLRLYPEARHPRLAEAAVMAVQTVESLTHRFAAHPGQGLPRDAFAAELVGMLEAYLTRAAT